MDDVQIFLAHAIELERDAARRYEDLTAVMESSGNREVSKFFKRMADFSRRHLKEAMQRGGFRDIPELQPHEWSWPGDTSPEVARWEGVDEMIDARAAMELALESERRGYAYYKTQAVITQDPDVRRLAAEFSDEERDHVEQLREWLLRLAA